MSSFIENETVTPNGSTTDFALANAYKEGTVKLLIDGKLVYDFQEKTNGANAPQNIVLRRAPASTRVMLVSYYKADEMNTLNQVRYLSVAQAKLNTRVTAIASVTDADLDRMIQEAEILIDRFIAYPYEGYHSDVGQQRLFPRVEDYNASFDTDKYPTVYPGIPQAITLATLYALENIVLVGSVTASSNAGAMLSERLGDYSYQRAEAIGAAATEAGQLIGQRARSLAQKFRKGYRGMQIDDQSSNYALLNSRQRLLRNKS
jgi:hypothetical protein